MLEQLAQTGSMEFDGVSACRHCPFCDAVSTISAKQELWPPGWICEVCGGSLPMAQGFPLLAPLLDEVAEGFDLANFPLLAEVEARNFWFVSRNELIRWLIERHAPKAQRVLEIGCGTGFTLNAVRAALPNALIAGSELHSKGLVTARRRHGGTMELFQMDARKSRLTDALDAVGAFDVLEHIPEDQNVLREIERMLKPGGVLIATVPQHTWMWSTSDDIAFHQRRYRRGELAAKARAAGLQPIYISSFVTLAFPMMMASRILDRMRPQELSLTELHTKQFQISNTVNGVLLYLCRIEQWLRRARMPLPFGGSQVLVARRPLSARKSDTAKP